MGGSGDGMRRALLRRVAVAALVSAFYPRSVDAQRDTLIVPGPRYAPEFPMHETLLGSRYRELWTTPIRVPFLDLDTVAGGLTPVEEGGHKQTMALRFVGADGREYNFRSADKELTAAMPDYAKETFLDWLRQDQTSAQLPTSPIVARSLLDAVGILNPQPRLAVLPDHPRLGEFRERFAGVLGTFELHADEYDEETPAFAGAERVAGTDRVLEHLEEDRDHRVDDREFLKARLMDLLIGDWDRHGGQWRWARYDRDGVHWWVPIPEDRDYAFVVYDGKLLDAVRAAGLGRLVEYGPEYSPLLAMMDNSLDLNRRLLSELPREAWDSVAAALQAQLTDEVLAAAVRQMPEPHYRIEADYLLESLRARRDALTEHARDFYSLLASNVEVHSTDFDEVAEITRLPDGRVRVEIRFADAGEGERPVYSRTIRPAETNEVRIFLHGGDDVALVTGERGSVDVRLIGGGGDDRFEDRSGGSAAFYDHRGDNEFVRGPGTKVSTRTPPEPPDDDSPLPEQPRDWGESWSTFKPLVAWYPHAELILGGGPAWTKYGFRRDPYAWRVGARGMYAPLHGRGGAEVFATVHLESSPIQLRTLGHVSNLRATVFNGLGNDTEDLGVDAARVWEREASIRQGVGFPLFRDAAIFAGAVVKRLDPETDPGTPVEELEPYGGTAVGQVGALAEVELDTRDDAVFPRSGVHAALGGTAYPGVWGLDQPLASTTARAATYLPLPGGSVLAFRAGGEAVFGDFPYHEAAFIGGSETLRGYRFQRFAGDRALFGATELRVPIIRAELLVHGTLGLSAFTDAGRVYVDGESPGGWHTGTGGSLWFTFPLGAATLTVAQGEETRAHFKLSMPF